MIEESINESLKEYLLKARERSGLSQADVAARSEIFGLGKVLDQRSVSRIEMQPISVDAVKMAAYLSAIGLEPNEYYQRLREISEQGVIVKMDAMTLKDSKFKIREAVNRINNAKEKLSTYDHNYIDKNKLLTQFNQYETALETLNRKPTIGFYGSFDAGKSTIINTVINESLLPTKFQPTTSIVILVMHFDDRPNYISSETAVFRRGFKPYMIHSIDEAKNYLIEEGGKDLLHKYGVHQYEVSENTDAYIAIVFSNAPILRSVWLLDTPGNLNSANEADTEIALSGVELIDGLVYISPMAGFMGAADVGLASNILRHRRPIDINQPLKHILFIQSHCFSELDAEELDKTKLDTFVRIGPQLNEIVIDSWLRTGHIHAMPKPEELAARTTHFWRENTEYRSAALSQIGQMANFLVENQSSIINNRVDDIMASVVQTIKDAISGLNHKKLFSEQRVKEVEEKDATFRQAQQPLIKEFNNVIDSCAKRKANDLEVMRLYYQSKTSIEGLEDIISSTYSDQKTAQAELGNYVSQILTSKLETTIEVSGGAISKEIDYLLEKWQHASPSVNKPKFIYANDGSRVEVSDFNTRAAFIGGLAGLGSLGAMALYVSTISSNLGAYILVGKAAGVLVSLGLVGSVTTVTSFVAAIGGPITIGLVLAGLVGLLIYRLAGGNWQKSLAKKASEDIRGKNALSRIEKAVTDFWDNTAKAIKAGLDELVLQTDEHIAKMMKEAHETYDIADLKSCSEKLDKLIPILQANESDL